MERVSMYRYQMAAHLQVSDEDAGDFLQSQFSNELRPFDPGRSVYGLWLDVKGKVVADSCVLCQGEEAFLIFSEHCSSESISEKLERHIIADDVCIEVGPVVDAIALIGEPTVEFWAALELEAPKPGQFVQSEACVAYPGRRWNGASYEIVCRQSGVMERVEQWARQAEWPNADAQKLEQLRIEAGYPRIPQEVGPNDLPGEGGLVEKGAVSLTKGCYLGQEVVARMHNLGRPQRGLFFLESESAPVPAGDELKNKDGKTVGVVRTVLPAASGGWSGVAMLKVRFAQIGDVLETSEGTPVHVIRPI